MSTSIWRQNFLQRRDLNVSDSRLLCAYRCTGDEFLELSSLFHEHLGNPAQ